VAKSIHERVRATIEREQRAADARDRFQNRAKNAASEKQARADADRERGVTLYLEGACIPVGASRALREGYLSAERHDLMIE
jgi:hypothetical protein